MENGDVVAVVINWRELNNEYYSLNLKEIGVEGKVRVRDLWKHEYIESDGREVKL
jgi:hypothetical protein